MRRPRVAGAHALSLEVTGARDQRLLVDAERGSPGLYLLDRRGLGEVSAEPESLPGRTRQALLLARKHVDGRRVCGLERVPGERWLVVRLSSGLALSLRFSDPAPALTLVAGEEPLATLGTGPPAWPLPSPQPRREWDAVGAEELDAALARAREAGRSPVGGLLRACPGLGPSLARELAADPGAFEALSERLRAPRPRIASAVPLETAADADLASPHAPVLLPIEPPRRPAALREEADWIGAAGRWRIALERGRRFERARRAAVDRTSRERRRLEQLELNLSRDRLGLPDPQRLRRDADALLATPDAAPDEAGRVRVPDPWSDAGAVLELDVDPQLGTRRSAERFYARARRAERAAAQLAERLEATRRALAAARERESAAREARDVAALPEPPPSRSQSGRAEAGGPRHYLTTRGLSMLVGRGARENHELTFSRARPEDLWLHARDHPGAHVILRDPEGRATVADRREAAEVAAFFSEARRGGPCDVHVARRKHLRAARGGPGRVQVFHSETLRVEPRDPEGRLRRRPSR